MIDKDTMRQRFDGIRSEGKERLNELKAEGKERFEELRVEGNELATRVRELIKEGKTRKITIKKGDRVLAEFPLAIGLGGAAAAVILQPALAAIAAIGTLVSDVDVIVHRDADSSVPARTVDYDEVDS